MKDDVKPWAFVFVAVLMLATLAISGYVSLWAAAHFSGLMWAVVLSGTFSVLAPLVGAVMVAPLLLLALLIDRLTRRNVEEKQHDTPSGT